jgi:phospholipase C
MTILKYGLSVCVFLILGLFAGCGGIGNSADASNGNGRGGTGPDSIQAVNHVIIFMQENRSFDHYFARLKEYRQMLGLPADIDETPANVSNIGYNTNTLIAPFHLVTECTEDLSPFWNEDHVDFNLHDPLSDLPKMDGFAHTAGKFASDENTKGHGPYTDTVGYRAMGYYTAQDLPFYYFMASQFATSDRWFSPVFSRTQSNRMYLLAATSEGYVYPPASGLTSKTIFENLDSAGVSWKIYETDPGGTYLTYFPAYYSQHQANIVPASQFAVDAANGKLPAVALIESGSSSQTDEHPPNPVQKGEIYAASIVNTLLDSPSWKDSVLILTWDENGGFYDHVPPLDTVNPDGIKPRDLQPNDFPGDFTRTGYRVPLMVISPFAKKGYVSHTPTDFTAMLKFIETRWHLPALTRRDAQQMDMTEFFDWSAPNANPPRGPRPFETLPCTPTHMR